MLQAHYHSDTSADFVLEVGEGQTEPKRLKPCLLMEVDQQNELVTFDNGHDRAPSIYFGNNLFVSRK